jgi:hypothetical protein
MNNIYTVNDLLKTAAVAFNNRDEDTIHKLISVAEDWLQPDDERHAHIALLESLLNGIEDISSLNHEVLVLEDEVSELTKQLQGE